MLKAKQKLENPATAVLRPQLDAYKDISSLTVKELKGLCKDNNMPYHIPRKP